AGGFDLAPGAEQIVRARWPARFVPAAGTHACWLAAVLTRSDRPIAGRHVWEHGNLAQKNLTVIGVKPGASIGLPFVLPRLKVKDDRLLELVRPLPLVRVAASVVPRSTMHRPPPDVGDAVEHAQLGSHGSRNTVFDGDDRDALADAGFEINRARPFQPGRIAQ